MEDGLINEIPSVVEQPQGDESLEMGDLLSEKTAKASIPNLKAQLLNQCKSDQQKAAVEAGSWEIEEIDES